jgi:curli biogenesis system outer membrane secretion channel CsgG
MSSGIKDPQAYLQTNPKAPDAPPTIEGYQFARVVGRGGMGVVWEAIQLGTARHVAVKFMSADLLSERARRRFSREVKLAARLTHPHIVRIYDSGLHQNAYFYVMELINGIPLDQAIKTRAYSAEQIVRLMADVCKAVDYAHTQGVIHRDLKPANILVSEDGSPHILDFGLAKEFAAEPDDVAESFLVSSEGLRAGTPIYMSPEQAAGKLAMTPASDIYSIGAILYHMLTGQYAHDPKLSLTELYHQIATVPPRPLCEVAKGLPKSLERVLAKSMSLDPRQRFETASKMADALLACVAKDMELPSSPVAAEVAATQRGGLTQPPMRTLSPRRRKFALYVAAAVILMLTVGLGIWKIFGSAAKAKAPATVRIVAVAPVDVEATAGTRLSPTRSAALGNMIRQKIEERLVRVPQITVAERTQLDTVLRERGFTASSNIADAAKMAVGAKVIGASVLVAPTIVDVDSKPQKFSGYGVSTSRTTVIASILVRVIDVPTATIKYSATYQGRAVRESSSFSPDDGADGESEAVRDAVSKACADASFVNAVKR